MGQDAVGAAQRGGPRSAGRGWLYLALALLYLLHNDLWLWNDGRLVLGLPVGLTYHVLYCLATAGLLALLVKHAWPAHLAAPDEGPQP